jgi:hypothetical protein
MPIPTELLGEEPGEIELADAVLGRGLIEWHGKFQLAGGGGNVIFGLATSVVRTFLRARDSRPWPLLFLSKVVFGHDPLEHVLQRVRSTVN